MSMEPLDLSKLTKKDIPLIKKLDRQQEDMVNQLFKKRKVIVDAVAGSGKTTVLTQAMRALQNKQMVDTIYYVVFPVQEKSLGYLPGGVAEKVQEYAQPFVSALIDAGVNPQEIEMNEMCNVLVKSDFKVVPHTFMRGRTLTNAGIIIDEAQNGTLDELRKVFTRVADDCYVAIAGHNGQQDIKNSGFSSYIHHFKRGVETGEYTDIGFAELSVNYRGAFSAYADKISELHYKEELNWTKKNANAQKN